MIGPTLPHEQRAAPPPAADFPPSARDELHGPPSNLIPGFLLTPNSQRSRCIWTLGPYFLSLFLIRARVVGPCNSTLYFVILHFIWSSGPFDYVWLSSLLSLHPYVY